MSSIIDTRIICVLFSAFVSALAIDCYVCTSVDKSNPVCEDTFNATRATVHLIERNCMYGFFRGTHCIKLSGHREDGSHLLVRHCSDDNWGSHCGLIRFDYGVRSEKIYGCLESCDHDGCNGGQFPVPYGAAFLFWGSIIAFIIS